MKNKNAFLDYPLYLKYFRLFVIFFGMFIVLLTIFNSNNAIVTLFLGIGFMLMLVKQISWIKSLNHYFQKIFQLDYLILEFIISNNLSSEKNGLESAELAYEKLSEQIIIYAIKYGDRFSSKLENLDIELTALLNLPLTEKIIREGVVEYHFQTVKPKRRFLMATDGKNYSDSHEIDLGYGITYNPIKCPHILVAGGTGSGKSLFISFVILQLLQKKSGLYLCDPKNSDLGSLSVYLGTDRVATTPNNIARIVRLAVEEMKERYEFMNAPENFKYGANYSDFNFNQIWLIFDEIGAFVATATDKKSKEVVNEVMDGIKQLILLGRQAGTYVLVAGQQINANNLNTELRDNLGLRLALGSNSQEGYRMVLGSAMPDNLKKIEEKGAGFLYMQGSGKDAAYYEAPYMNPNEFDFISELQLYINNENV
ncbi:hypothetical protein BFC22_05225 [Carnobacterium divergens]|nr:hypothetical protein BFC22_05225 [Carnobacterium divergens]